MSPQKNPYILALNELGQSVWYDNLSRDVLRSGQLKVLIEQGVSGLTSNPTIFKQAIADTNNYDDDMKSSELKGLGTEALCEELMMRDVAAAADLLRPTYDATGEGTAMRASRCPHTSPLIARARSTLLCAFGASLIDRTS